MNKEGNSPIFIDARVEVKQLSMVANHHLLYVALNVLERKFIRKML